MQIKMATDLLSFLIDSAQGRNSGDGSASGQLSDAEVLASLVTRFKHPAFQDEQEVRYVAALPADYPEKFREGARGLIPYIELGSSPTQTPLYIDRAQLNLPITKLMCGPAGAEEQRPIVAAARRLMKQHGYDVHVTGSVVPYRFG